MFYHAIKDLSIFVYYSKRMLEAGAVPTIKAVEAAKRPAKEVSRRSTVLEKRRRIEVFIYCSMLVVTG